MVENFSTQFSPLYLPMKYLTIISTLYISFRTISIISANKNNILLSLLKTSYYQRYHHLYIAILYIIFNINYIFFMYPPLSQHL